MWHLRTHCSRWNGALMLAAVWTTTASLPAADRATIDRVIRSGAAFLQTDLQSIGERSELGLVGLALLKANTPHDALEFQKIAEVIQAKVKNGVYKPAAHHIYEAGTDAGFLADFDGEKYRSELEAISNYIISTQLANGGFDYPKDSGHFRGTEGDTSVTQYACLALWAAQRAGVDVPREPWEKVLGWLISSQNADGGFSYVPGTGQGLFGGASDLSMTFAGLGGILIATHNLHEEAAKTIYSGRVESNDDPMPQTQSDDPLVKIDLSTIPVPDAAPSNNDPAKTARPVPSIPLSRIKPSLERGKAWINARYRPYNDTGTATPYYYFYAVERFGSLADVKLFGTHDWFDLSSSALAQRQQPNGSFPSNQYTSPAIDTSFAVLFLTRSTGKILNRVSADPTHGGGLLTGGKGEPTAVVAAKKEPTPLDQLLKSLQNPGSLDLEAAQTSLLDQIQLGDRTELVGQKDLLVDLIKHPHGEVRRTAAWALGRTNDLHLARHLIDALEDADVGVMMEAHAGLCWLARRFDGYGLAANPLDSVGETASEQERATAIHGWRVRARREWGNWYLRVRPYADRGDEFEAQLKQRMGEK